MSNDLLRTGILKWAFQTRFRRWLGKLSKTHWRQRGLDSQVQTATWIEELNRELNDLNRELNEISTAILNLSLTHGMSPDAQVLALVAQRTTSVAKRGSQTWVVL